jgi:hypothetical protein
MPERWLNLNEAERQRLEHYFVSALQLRESFNCPLIAS